MSKVTSGTSEPYTGSPCRIIFTQTSIRLVSSQPRLMPCSHAMTSLEAQHSCKLQSKLTRQEPASRLLLSAALVGMGCPEMQVITNRLHTGMLLRSSASLPVDQASLDPLCTHGTTCTHGDQQGYGLACREAAVSECAWAAVAAASTTGCVASSIWLSSCTRFTLPLTLTSSCVNSVAHCAHHALPRTPRGDVGCGTSIHVFCMCSHAHSH